MSLRVEDIPLFITPPCLCTPSRLVGETRLASVLRELNDPENISDVLDVGCGGGEYRFLFPGCVYTGIDIVDRQYAQKKADNHRFVIGNAGYLPIKSASQDFLYCSYAFEYFPEPKMALEEMNRVLRPGGFALVCLPAKWVVVYDFLSDFFRSLGISVGRVSSQPGIRCHSPAEFQQLVGKADFNTVCIFPVYGWAVLLLKAVLSWYRVILHLATRMGRKLSRGKLTKIMPLYVHRRVTTARSFQEWRDILDDEFQTECSLGRAFLALVRTANEIDRLTGFRPTVEYVALLVKADKLK